MVDNFDDRLKRAWERYKEKRIKREQQNQSYERMKREESLKYFTKHFRSILSLPILIGIVAAVIMYYDFGWLELEKTLLSWIIGITVIATVITLLERYTKIWKL